MAKIQLDHFEFCHWTGFEVDKSNKSTIGCDIGEVILRAGVDVNSHPKKWDADCDDMPQN